MSKPTNSNDGCPNWAQEAIEQLKQMEIYLGNIPNDPRWQSQHVNAMSRRTFTKGEQVFDEDKAEFAFKRIVRSLHHEGFSARNIVDFINSRIRYQGGPPYCSIAEVEEALGHNA